MDYMDVDLRLLLDHYNRELKEPVCKCYLYQVCAMLLWSVVARARAHCWVAPNGRSHARS